MKYPELVKVVSAKSGIRKDDVSLIIDTLREVMVDKLAVENAVISIPGLGKFSISDPKNRKNNNYSPCYFQIINNHP